jgi:hypothetical protein
VETILARPRLGSSGAWDHSLVFRPDGAIGRRCCNDLVGSVRAIGAIGVCAAFFAALSCTAEPAPEDAALDAAMSDAG